MQQLPQEQWRKRLRENILYELSIRPKFILYEMNSPEMEEYITTIAAIVGGRVLLNDTLGGEVFSYRERITLVREEIRMLKESES